MAGIWRCSKPDDFSFKNVNFKRLFIIVLAGQALSLLITGTGVTSELLARNHGVFIPTTQSFINYFFLFVIYGSLLLYRGQFWAAFKKRWWVYLILGVIDVEANFLVVKAYQYTTITSIMLIDCSSIPTVMLLSYFILKARYRILHYIGVAFCLVGVVCLVVSDIMTGKNEQNGENLVLGDMLCLAGAILYGVSNVVQEYLVKQGSSIEFLALMGLWATVVGGIQMAILEREILAAVPWNGEIIGLLFGFAIFLFLMYSLVPYFLRSAGATAMNLSLLTSDFYALLFGIFLFQFKITWLYIFAFLIILLGLIIYERQPPVTFITNGEIDHGVSEAPLTQESRTNLTESEEEQRLEQHSYSDSEVENDTRNIHLK